MSDHREVARVPYRAEIVSLSPNGRFLMAIDDKKFRVWDIIGPEPKVVVPDTENHGAVFRPDSRYLAIGRADRTLVMLDLYGQEPERVWRPTCMKHVSPKAFDPSGKRLLVIIDSTANVFDVSVPTSSYLHLSQAGQYDTGCWHPNSRYVALVNVSKTITIEIWDVERNREIGPPLQGCVSGGLGMAFTPDGELLVSWGWEGTVRVWQFRTGRQVLQYPGAYSVHFGRDGGCLFMANQRLVRAGFVASHDYRVFGTQLQLPIALWGGSIHPDGRLLAACSNAGAHFWDLVTGDEVAFAQQLQAHSLAFASPDELVILNKEELATMSVSKEGPDKSLFRIGPAKRLNVGAFAGFTCSTDGTTLAQAMFETKGVLDGVSVFVHRDREWVRRPFDVHVHANGAVVSPDGTMIATDSFRDVVKTRVWATADGRQLAAYDTWGETAIAFSPNNRWLAVGSSGLSRIIPVSDWESGVPFDAGPGAMCFSPSSDLLAVETGTGAVQCFDSETGRKIVRLEEPNQIKVRQLAVTPDGTRLVAISDESKAIHVWDLRRIRQGLSALGLDWKAPPFPPTDETDQDSKPRLRVEVEPGPKR